MNKSLIGFFLLLIALFIGAMYYSKLIQAPFLSASNDIKVLYLNSISYIENSIQKYTFQTQHIQNLNNQLKVYKNNHLIMHQLANNLRDLFEENNSTLRLNPKVELVRAISYSQFANFNKVWLDVKDYNSSKIYGLTYKEVVAGIVISKNSRPLGLLNKDIKSSYSVYIGKNKAPGIAHGNNSEHLIIKFIPAWYNIKKGDEVITSGLDNIFFKGLKVGYVLSVTLSQGYQNAIVEPYYKEKAPNYFHMIKRLK